MYMRNNGYNRYANPNYNMREFPPNYSGQYRNDPPMPAEDKAPGIDESAYSPEPLHNTRSQSQHQHDPPEKKDPEESKDPKEKKNNSILGNLFGGNKDGKDGKKGGLLSGFFGKGDGDKDKDGKDGGFLSRIELEDLILIAVIFFLLKDGFEDDLILILAIILFSA